MILFILVLYAHFQIGNTFLIRITGLLLILLKHEYVPELEFKLYKWMLKGLRTTHFPGDRFVCNYHSRRNMIWKLIQNLMYQTLEILSGFPRRKKGKDKNIEDSDTDTEQETEKNSNTCTDINQSVDLMCHETELETEDVVDQTVESGSNKKSRYRWWSD